MSRTDRHHEARWLGVAAVILITAGVVVYVSGLDAAWLMALHADAPSRTAVVAWSCITVLGMTWPALILLTALDRRSGRLAALVLPTLIVGSLLTHVPKWLVAAPRPAGSPYRDALHVIGHAFTGSVSMPSGHALTAAAAAALVWVAYPGTRRAGLSIVAFALAAIIGFSRLVVGAHWPSDVLVGFGLGLLAVSLSLRLRRAADALAPRIASRTGQLWLALVEIALAGAFLSDRTGYPDGRPMVIALAWVALLSAMSRGWVELRREHALGAKPA